MKMIFKYLKPYFGRMFLGFLIKVAGTFMDLGLPWVLAYIIDDIIPLDSVSLILIWGIVMLVLSIGARMGNIIANRMASRVAGNTIQKLRHDLFYKIEQLSGKQIDHFSIPSLVSRMTSDTYNIHQMVGMMQRLGVRAPIILIGGIIITSTLEPVLTLILLAILPLLAIVVYIVSKKGIPLYTKTQSAVDQMIRTVRENITGIRVVKALSKTEYEQKRFAKVNESVVDRELEAGSTMAVINPVMNLLLNVGLTLVVVAGAYRVNSGASEVGKIVAFLSYFTMILNAMLMITRIFVIISKATASAGRIKEVLESETDLKVYEKNMYPDCSNAYHIEFKNVSFAYHKSNKNEGNDTVNANENKANINEGIANPIESIAYEDESKANTSDSNNVINMDEKDDTACVTNISFQLKRGDKLGIIGSTGSGKTTLINLLMRYYDVEDGAILIDGEDIRTMELQELRKKIGVVFQNDTIFADTVKENINLHRGISDDKIMKAAKDARAHEYIEQLGAQNEKYQYQIATNGANLSGGQKQRLLIGRALAGDPDILILDDSSSALDYKTDANLRKAIQEHYADTTTIMIAQRISSIMQMDHILVIEDGKIIGYGNHDDLLHSCEIYDEIYQSQMGNH
jgi:ATP-binding cassette, subfamily B, multidrug efflux pump